MLKKITCHVVMCGLLNFCGIVYGMKHEERLIEYGLVSVNGDTSRRCNVIPATCKIDRKAVSLEFKKHYALFTCRLNKDACTLLQNEWSTRPQSKSGSLELLCALKNPENVTLGVSQKHENKTLRLTLSVDDYGKFLDATTEIVSISDEDADQKKSFAELHPTFYKGLKIGAWGVGIFGVLFFAALIKKAEPFLQDWLSGVN